MKATRLITLAAITAAGAMSLAACGGDNNNPSSSGAPSASASIACATGKLSGAGSTFQQNIVEQWIKDYDAACSGASLDYQGTGSGAGVQQFGAGTIDFAGSDAVMTATEQAAANKRCGGNPAIHLPVTAGGIALLYKLSGVTNLNLSPATVAGIFQDTITKWNDPAIAADNPGVTLPNEAIQAVHRSDSSGTTNIFSSWLTATAPTWKLGKGKELNWNSKIVGEKGSAGETQFVGQTEGSITYAEASYAAADNLPVANVKNGAGQYAALNTANVSAALASATLPATGNDLKASYNFANTTPGIYPITGLSYEIVCSAGTPAAKLPLLKSYLTYATGAGQASAAGLGFAPLPAAVAARVQTAIAALS